MDYTTGERQQKFREKMKESGKKQRAFFLSDEAMESIKNHKGRSGAPSLNHALESLLTDTDRQQEVINQSRKVAEAFTRWAAEKSSDTAAIGLANAASKLNELVKDFDSER